VKKGGMPFMFNQKPDELETPQDTGRLSKKV
jgi:hypothetical protein